MSHIDTIPHVHVGYLAGYPVYHPKQASRPAPRGDYDFACSPDNLVIGGGSGEHPGLVVHSLDKLAALYLEDIVSRTLESAEKYGGDLDTVMSLNRVSDSLAAFLGDGFRLGPYFEYCQWSAEQTAEFVERSRSRALTSPYRSETYQSFERWLALSLGEFVWQSLPVCVAALREALADDYARAKLRAHQYPMHGNLLLLPHPLDSAAHFQ